ncbi:MAG: hypothetical protein AAF922_13430 [Pseudomonadota bacterium]
MTQVGASLALGICASWLGFVVAGFVLPSFSAALIGGAFGVTLAWPLRQRLLSTGAVAIFAPFGVMLPALALRHLAVSLGVDVPGFSSLELFAFLMAYILFLMAAFGLLPVDFYRLGYSAKIVGLMTLALCLYALASGNWFLALVAVGGQAVWAVGWSSSNWFDTVLHVTLVPAAFITLLMRLL